jgi:hypothetical protein
MSNMDATTPISVIGLPLLYHILSFAIGLDKHDYGNMSRVNKEWNRTVKLVEPLSVYRMRHQMKCGLSVRPLALADVQQTMQQFYPWLEGHNINTTYEYYKKVGKKTRKLRPIQFGYVFTFDVSKMSYVHSQVLLHQLIIYLKDLSRRTVREAIRIIRAGNAAKEAAEQGNLMARLKEIWDHWDGTVEAVTKINRRLDLRVGFNRDNPTHTSIPNEIGPPKYLISGIRDVACFILVRDMEKRRESCWRFETDVLMRHIHLFHSCNDCPESTRVSSLLFYRDTRTMESHAPLDLSESEDASVSEDALSIVFPNGTQKRLAPGFWQSSAVLTLLQSKEKRAIEWHTDNDLPLFDAAEKFYDPEYETADPTEWRILSNRRHLEDVFRLLLFSHMLQLQDVSIHCSKEILRLEACFCSNLFRNPAKPNGG